MHTAGPMFVFCKLAMELPALVAFILKLCSGDFSDDAKGQINRPGK